MPHGLVVEHVARNPVDEGGHGRRGLEAVAEDGAIGASAHLARVLGGDARRLLLRARQHYADPVEHDVLGRPHHVGGQAIVGGLHNVAREDFSRAHRGLLTSVAGARSLAWRPQRGKLGERRRTLDARASMAAEGWKRVQPAATNTHAAMVLTPARTMAAVAATATVVPVVFHQLGT